MLTRLPKQMFVGMIIAAHAVGAAQGIVYLRAEYAYLREYLEQQLTELRDEGLLGNGFDIRIQSGAGAYVCGDESALIESCEGKRGTPRLKPPFPVEHGFLGKPTVRQQRRDVCRGGPDHGHGRRLVCGDGNIRIERH